MQVESFILKLLIKYLGLCDMCPFFFKFSEALLCQARGISRNSLPDFSFYVFPEVPTPYSAGISWELDPPLRIRPTRDGVPENACTLKFRNRIGDANQRQSLIMWGFFTQALIISLIEHSHLSNDTRGPQANVPEAWSAEASRVTVPPSLFTDGQ
jgi:hypothetical protein